MCGGTSEGASEGGNKEGYIRKSVMIRYLYPENVRF
jgi:hypothetical protein